MKRIEHMGAVRRAQRIERGNQGRWLRAGMAAAALIALSGAGKESESELRVGLIAPFTGELAAIGRSASEGAELAVREINDSGGVRVGGLQLRLVIETEDSMGSPEMAVQAAQRLINQRHVDALVGPVLSITAAPVAELADRAGIPMITPSATSPGVTADRNCVYRACFSDSFQGRVMARFCFEELGARSAAVLFDVTNLYNRTIADVFRNLFQLMGGEILVYEGYTPEEKDFSKPLRLVAASSPDVLVLPNFRPDIFLQVREAHEAGFEGYIMGGDTMAVSDPAEFPLLEGAYFATHYAPEAPNTGNLEFPVRYKNAFNHPPSMIGALTYDSVRLLAVAADRLAGHPCKGMDSIRYNGVTGTIKFTPKGPEKECIIMRYAGGQPRYVMRYTP